MDTGQRHLFGFGTYQRPNKLRTSSVAVRQPPQPFPLLGAQREKGNERTAQ
jgi:hypothetical protein